jgi:hypothetical protein
VTLLLAGAAACGQGGVDGAPYVAPRPGTVYHYRGMDNTITAVDGWRTTYRDQAGREGLRIGLFLVDDPLHPAQVDSAALASLWPLRVGNEATVRVQRDPEVYRWDFRVTGIDHVEVGAGAFDAYVVQAVQTPVLVRTPQAAVTAMYTWWYAPRIAAVVKVRTSYLGGPAAGRVVESELLSIDTHAATDGQASAPTSDATSTGH